MPIKTSTYKYLVLVALAIGLAGVVFVAGKAPRLLENLILETVEGIHQKYDVQIALDKISVEGFLSVRLSNVSLKKEDNDLSVTVESIRAGFSLWQYVFSGNPVRWVEVDSPVVEARFGSDFNQSAKQDLGFDFLLNELVIKNGKANLTWKDRTLAILNLETRSRISSKRILFHYFSMETSEGSLLVDGEIYYDNARYLGLGSNLKIWLTTRLQDITELKKVKIPLRADLRLQGKVSYLSKKRGWEFNGKNFIEDALIDKVTIKNLKSSLFVNSSGLKLSQAVASFAGTSVYGDASFNFDKELNFSASVETKKASLYELLSDLGVKKSWADLSLSTKGSFKGAVLPEFSLNGLAKGEMSGLIVQEPAKDPILKTAYPITFDMKLAVDKESFKFIDASFKDLKSEFTADCDLFFKKQGMALSAQFINLDFDSIFNQIAEGKYFGSGVAKVKVSGPYKHIKIRAPVEFSDFRFDNFQFGQVKALISYKDDHISVNDIRAKQQSLVYSGDLNVGIKKPTSIKLNANLYQGRFEDLRRFILPELSDFKLSGPVSGHIELDGPVEKGYQDQLSGEVDLKINDGSRLFDNPLSGGRLKASMDAQLGKLEELSLNLEAARLNASGSYNKTSKTGAGDLKLFDSWLGSGDFNLSIKNNTFYTYGLFNISKTRASLEVGLEKSLPYQARVNMPYGPLRIWAKEVSWIENYRVQAGVQAKASGSLKNIGESDITLDLFPAVFYLGTLKLVASKHVEASYRKKKLSFDPIIFRSIYGDYFKLNGWVSPGSADIQFITKGDLWLLTHLDDRIEGAYGDFELSSQVRGKWEKLRYFGVGEISPDAYVSLRDYPPGLTNISGKIDLKGPTANLSLKGAAQGGDFDLSGRVNFARSAFSDLQVNLFKMPVYYGSFLSGIASGFLKLDGSFLEPLLSGNVQFSKLLMTKELNPKEFRSPRSRAKKQAMKFDVKLSSENPIRIESKSFNGELNGNLNLVGTSNSLGLLGELRVLSGEAYFRNNYYHILKAQANFDSPFRIIPNIDVEASSQILDYDVTVRAQGELDRPKLIFSSRPLLPQNDLLNLITFGFATRDNRDTFGTARTAGLEALSAYSGIGDRVLNALPGGKVDELRLGTLYNQNGGVTSSIVLGMQVFKGMRLRFQSALLQNSIGIREKRLELEKYINHQWRWRAVWKSDGTTNYGDAGADMWVRWDF